MIKVNVVSGFLGAGKTTLIKHLASALIENNEKVVILENEFGKIGIDGKMLEIEGLSVYEISSGCICCTLKNDFMSTLIRIADEICPDRILIEPSGIFVLSELHDIFKNPDVNSRLTLCSALTVIDSLHFLKKRNHYGYFFENQISYADRLILSKVQDISQITLISILEELQKINPSVDVVTDEWSSMSQNSFINLLEHQKTSILLEDVKQNNISSQNKHGNHHFMTFGFIPSKATWSKPCLSQKLSSFVNGSFGTMLRVKGHVPCENGMLQFNYVDGIYEIKEIPQEIAPSICFIGEDLNMKGITELFTL